MKLSPTQIKVLRRFAFGTPTGLQSNHRINAESALCNKGLLFLKWKLNEQGEQTGWSYLLTEKGKQVAESLTH